MRGAEEASERIPILACNQIYKFAFPYVHSTALANYNNKQELDLSSAILSVNKVPLGLSKLGKNFLSPVPEGILVHVHISHILKEVFT